MIYYPFLQEGAAIGVTAPSSGVQPNMHELLKLACSRMEMKGFNVICGDTVWTEEKAKSAPAKLRAAEFNEMMRNDDISLIIPPWGGELLIEILEYIDFDNIKKKWILGYSDISLLLLAITLRTGMATAHGTNLIDLRAEYQDETTAMWQAVLTTSTGKSIVQHSSPYYQKEWKSSSDVFHLTEPSSWKVMLNQRAEIQGRLLGGCIDVIRHIVGTSFGDVRYFQKNVINNEPIIWFLENCELSTVDLRRSLVQMKLAGWFDNCSGIMFGRSAANQAVRGYTVEDVYKDLANDLHVPIIYDIDCGHVPPQITLINGAYVEVEAEDGRGEVTQYFI